MHKAAVTDHPVHELIRNRWSPRSLADKPVPEEVLSSLFEAARWAASSYNEQPWSYIVASREDSAEFQRLLSSLGEGHRAGAKSGPVLAVGRRSLQFKLNGKPNAGAQHDLGLASATLTF